MYTITEERLVAVDGKVPQEPPQNSYEAQIFDTAADVGELRVRLADDSSDLLYLKPEVLDHDGEVPVHTTELIAVIADLKKLRGDEQSPEDADRAERVAQIVERVCEVLRGVGTGGTPPARDYALTLATELRVTVMELLGRTTDGQ